MRGSVHAAHTRAAATPHGVNEGAALGPNSRPSYGIGTPTDGRASRCAPRCARRCEAPPRPLLARAAADARGAVGLG